MTVSRLPTALFFSSSLLAAGFVSLTAGSDLISRMQCDQYSSGWDEANKLWRSGNMLLVIRHTERCQPGAANCVGITEDGIASAHHIGEGVNSLNMSGKAPFDVFYSPVLRTKMTTQAAFGDGQPLPAEWLIEGCKHNLLDKAKDTKRTGRNLILITHSTCINALEDENHNALINFNVGRDAFFGVSFLFELNTPTNEWVPMACRLQDGWTTGDPKPL